MAEALVQDGCCSGRAACRHFGLHRSTFAYAAKEPDAWLGKLKGALRRCSREYPEMGYQKITPLLQKEGWEVGSWVVQKLRREMGLRVPVKKPKVRRQGRSTGVPTKAAHRNHVWSYDFVHDRTMRGGALRMLNIIDEYTRECLCIHVDRRINACKVQAILAKTIAQYGQPQYIRSDNGPEFIAGKLQDWLGSEPQIKTLYIDPGSPWQNGYIESFNGRLRDECLEREQLWTLTEARVVIEDWRWKYNHIRPHRSLGYITPIEFAYPEEVAVQYQDSSRPTASLRPAIDFLYDLRDIINPVRLTQPVAQFG